MLITLFLNLGFSKALSGSGAPFDFEAGVIQNEILKKMKLKK